MLNSIQEVVRVLEDATRLGEDVDEPEGARYIQISETLANEMVMHMTDQDGKDIRQLQGLWPTLEGDAQIAAIAVERKFGRLIAFGDDGRDAAGGGKERCRFGTDNIEIPVFGGRNLPLGGQLIDLAFGNDGAGTGQNFEDLQAAIFDHQFKSAAKQKVADEHAC